jgi:D-lactate dehydrogenase (cytochrome)
LYITSYFGTYNTIESHILYTQFLQELTNLIGKNNVLTDITEQKKYVSDWFGRANGKALAVVKPANPNEIASIVKLSEKYRVSIVPQGGNTGLVGGGLPDNSGHELVLSLERISKIRSLDALGKTISVDAGVILENLHQYAHEHGLEFPLTMGSQGSATIGGLLSTNAGGTAVLRYGNARDLCLGLEVITAEGEIWNGLRSLRKDNTGYDLRDIFIGSEGTLGIITGAVLKLVPLPKARLSALLSLNSPSLAIQLLEFVQTKANSQLTAFELISDTCLCLVDQYFPQFSYPFSTKVPYCILIEISDNESEEHAYTLLNAILEEAFEMSLITDAIIPQSLSQSKRFWEIREHIPLSQVEDGKNIKHDISLPISKIPEFIEEAKKIISKELPNARIIDFGHLGDGNLHYNVAAPIGESPDIFMKKKFIVNEWIHDLVNQMGGSISAEHGIGTNKAQDLIKYKTSTELNLMKKIKAGLDPHGIFNPKKVLL